MRSVAALGRSTLFCTPNQCCLSQERRVISSCFIPWPGAWGEGGGGGGGHPEEERILCSFTEHTQAELEEARTYDSFVHNL